MKPKDRMVLERTLRGYVSEVITELSVDRKFLDRLQRMTGVKLPFSRLRGGDFNQVSSVAQAWLSEVEYEIGRPLWSGARAQVIRFASHKFPTLLAHFKGDVGAAEQTLWNLLNSKFHELKPSSR